MRWCRPGAVGGGCTTTVCQRPDGVDAHTSQDKGSHAAVAVLQTRLCVVHDELGSHAAQHFLPNTVTTSKYTALNFVPKFLFEQFSRFVNLYFLGVCVLQCIRAISLTNGVPTQAFALSFVIFFDGVITAREDYKRHQADRRANARRALVLDKSSRVFERREWRDIVVGDVVKTMRGEEFPADMVFLGASGDDDWQRSTCYVQTMQVCVSVCLCVCVFVSCRFPFGSCHCVTSSCPSAAAA
jgi:hypothetical protein